MNADTTIIGEHPAIRGVISKARKLASVARPVLVRGERGTGKELVARCLHNAGNRKDAPFITLNCGAFGGDILKTELFGCEKGAFTGADRQCRGRIERAHRGSLFLDEIGIMPMEFQEKLLRVVEYQEFERIGGSETLKVDVRIVAATNADLEAMTRTGDFRADLYDRLSFAVLEVPSLRERRSDIPLLIEYFIRELAAGTPAMPLRRLSRAALDDLMNYHWPGNVRQLRNVIEYVYIMSDEVEGEIQSSELPAKISTAESLGDTFDEQLESFQRNVLKQALLENGGNQKAAAAGLGLTYDRFRHMYKKLNLAPEGD